MSRPLAWVVALVCAASPVAAPAETALVGETPRLEVAIEPRSVTVGDRIAATLVVELDRSDSRSPAFPDWSRGWGELSVLSASDPARFETPRGVEWRQRLELAAFEIGAITLPEREVRLDGSPNAALKTPADLTIEVRSVLPEGDEAVEPLPAEPPRRLPLSKSFWWTAGALAAIAVALAIVAARRRRSPAIAGSATLAPLAELELALSALRTNDPIAEHATLSLALRRYLGRTLSLPARESTTSELSLRLTGRAIERAVVQRTVRLLRDVDQVKFARREASRAELERRRDEVRALATEIESIVNPPELPAAGAPPGAPPKASAA